MSTITDMKIFGYRRNEGMDSPYGITCGIVIAESMDSAITILKNNVINDDCDDTYWEEYVKVFEIPFTEGYTLIGEYSE